LATKSPSARWIRLIVIRLPVRSRTSASDFPNAKLSVFTKNIALKIRGEVSAIGGSRSGSSRGATSHRNNSPIDPTMTAGRVKSNISNLRIPMSAAMATTSRLVDVPIAVPMPPTRVARPMGINMAEEDKRLRSETVIRIGSNRITIGVLFRNALRTAQQINVPSKASLGRAAQALATMAARGCSAPVVSRPLPMIISETMVTSAEWPNPLKNSAD
jgi:hypothetical protein